MSITRDDAQPGWQQAYDERAAFARVRNAERDYGRRLRQVARTIGDFVKAFLGAGKDVDLAHLATLLDRYGVLLEPWARAVASRFVSEVERRDAGAWSKYAKRMSRALELEIATAPTGEMLRRFLDSQVQLITSLPEEAARRVHEIAVGNIYSGARYDELIQQILNTGHVTQSRATLIARTETARVSSALTMVRAQHVGSVGYIWRTARDGRVRLSHKRMEGQFVRWDSPPVVDPGVPPYHAGMFPNCRCFSEPVIPDRYMTQKAA